MRQPRKPMGSPGGTGGRFDAMPGNGAGDLPGMSAAARAVAMLNRRRHRTSQRPAGPEGKPKAKRTAEPGAKTAPAPEPESGASVISVETKDGLATTAFADGGHPNPHQPAPAAGLHPRLDRYRTLPPRDHFDGMTPREVNPGYQAEMQALLARAIKNHNPNLINAYNPWNYNCQRAVVAAELRMRGYDVNAVGSGRRMCDSQPVDIADMFQTQDGRRRRFSDEYPTTEAMGETMLAKYPVGSRFLITGKQGRRKKVGHIWNAEIVADDTAPTGKRLVYYDMQKPLPQKIFDGTAYESYFHAHFRCEPVDTGSSDEERTGAYSKNFHNVAYFRVDDMEPSDRILDGGIYGVPYCEPAGRKTRWTKSELGRVNQVLDPWEVVARNRQYYLRSVD